MANCTASGCCIMHSSMIWMLMLWFVLQALPPPYEADSSSGAAPANPDDFAFHRRAPSCAPLDVAPRQVTNCSCMIIRLPALTAPNGAMTCCTSSLTLERRHAAPIKHVVLHQKHGGCG